MIYVLYIIYYMCICTHLCLTWIMKLRNAGYYHFVFVIWVFKSSTNIWLISPKFWMYQ